MIYGIYHGLANCLVGIGYHPVDFRLPRYLLEHRAAERLQIAQSLPYLMVERPLNDSLLDQISVGIIGKPHDFDPGTRKHPLRFIGKK